MWRRAVVAHADYRAGSRWYRSFRHIQRRDYGDHVCGGQGKGAAVLWRLAGDQSDGHCGWAVGGWGVDGACELAVV
jgi:hypothetical protein